MVLYIGLLYIKDASSGITKKNIYKGCFIDKPKKEKEKD